MRLFIGIPLPERTKKNIYGIVSKYKGLENVKWVKKENLHITLKFLGEVHDNKVEKIISTIEQIDEFKKFTVKIKNIGSFPSQKSPKVIWIGVEEGNNLVREINKRIEKRLKKEGFKEEKRFHPHITICRVKRYSEELNELFKEKVTDSFEVCWFNLYQSILQRQGPEYRVIKQFPLRLK